MPISFEVIYPDGRREWLFGETNAHYRLADGKTIPVNDVPVWCRGCHGFSNVERLQSLEEHDREAERFAAHASSGALSDENETIENEWIEMQAKRRELLKSRQTPPRCLKCGGTDHVALPTTGNKMELPTGEVVEFGEGGLASMGQSGALRLFDRDGKRII